MRHTSHRSNFSVMLYFTILIFSLLVLLSACVDEASPTPNEDQKPVAEENGPLKPIEEEPPLVEEPEEPESYTLEASLIAVGDIMTHYPQIISAYDAETKTYSFDSYFTEIKPYLEGDWVFGNLETTLAGKESGYSGYPQFNSPDELADALKNAGFNILQTANNHSMDRFEKGLLRTLDVLRDRNLHAVGTHSSQEEADEILVVTKNDISMAILAYTYGTNGIPLPNGKDYLVHLIDEAKIAEDIRKARELGVDVVTVALHMEGEYHRMPNDNQMKLTEHVIQAGADIILGSHPHIVQPYEVIEVMDEYGLPRQGVVIYSLGNFISNQGPPRTAKYTDVGVVFKIQIKKHYPNQDIEIGAIKSTSTWVHRYGPQGKLQYRILPIESVLAAKKIPEEKDPLLEDHHYELLEAYLHEMDQHIHAFLTD